MAKKVEVLQKVEVENNNSYQDGNGVTVTTVVTRTAHWGQFVVDKFGACDVPDNLLDFATPEKAWKNVDENQLQWILGEVGIAVPKKLATAKAKKLSEEDGWSGYTADDISWEDFSAKEIRAHFPELPKAVSKAVNDWLKDK